MTRHLPPLAIALCLTCSCAAVAAEPAPPAPAAATEEVCRFVIREKGELEAVRVQDFHVAGTKGPLPKVKDVEALMCNRSSIVPVSGDHRVLSDMEIPFAISDGERVVWLGVKAGRIQLSWDEETKISDAESKAMQAWTDEAQAAFNAAPTKD